MKTKLTMLSLILLSVTSMVNAGTLKVSSKETCSSFTSMCITHTGITTVVGCVASAATAAAGNAAADKDINFVGVNGDDVQPVTDTACSDYESICTDSAGVVTVSGCVPPVLARSNNATFQLTAATTAKTDTSVTVTIKRIIAAGGVAGYDELAMSSTDAASNFDSDTLTFLPTDGNSKVQTVSVSFAAPGSPIVSVTNNGENQVTPTAAIVVTN